jgi:hypothetical protein
MIGFSADGKIILPTNHSANLHLFGCGSAIRSFRSSNLVNWRFYRRRHLLVGFCISHQEDNRNGDAYNSDWADDESGSCRIKSDANIICQDLGFPHACCPHMTECHNHSDNRPKESPDRAEREDNSHREKSV